MRLATFALPDTAPTCGSANGPISFSTVSGSKIVSPSTMTTSSVRVSCRPVFRAAGLPALRCVISRTPGRSRPCTTDAVSSVEPSSTTITSTGCVDATTDRTAASMPASSL